MKHVFIFNPKTFYEQQWLMDVIFDDIGQYFRSQEKLDFSTHVSRYPREAIGIIQKQADEAKDGETVRIYAIGGDGILFDCLNGIVGLPNMELAAVPYGKTNDFIRAFGEERTELFKDIPSLVTASSVPTDIISAGNNYAINGCSVGLVSAAAVTMRGMNLKLGKFANFFLFHRFLSFLSNLPVVLKKQINTHAYKITIDDQDYSGNYSIVNIANGPYYDGNKSMAAGAMPDDGLMDVVLFKSIRPLAALWSMEKYSRGKLPSNCVLVQAKKITVQSVEPVWFQLDGELFQDTSISFEVIPGAVQVVAVNGLIYRNSGH